MDRCRCGGTYVSITDGVTTEAGGVPASHFWAEVRCDKCGCEILETCDKCKEAEKIGA